MEFELWYLVSIPLLFAAGWCLRGVDIKQRKVEKQGLEDNYFKGLSLLLSDEPDKAIDQFIEVVRLDPETIELHHALGNLFRRRGQFDRAIRLHSFLVNRSELPETERATALSELALDFLKAGTYDRAEAAYQSLANFKDRRHEAVNALMHIYCTEREWVKAIEQAQLLQREAGKDLHVEIAHYYCELALLARQSKDTERALQFARDARSVNPSSPRALALSADLALEAGDADEALTYWKTIEEKRSEYLPLIATKKAQVLAERNRQEAIEYLENVFERTGSLDILNAVAMNLSTWGQVREAEKFAQQALKKRPSMSAFAVLCRLRSKAAPEDEEAKMLAELTARQAKTFARYQCSHCGFLAHTFTWQCPGCETWDAFPPTRVEESKKASGY